MKTILYHEAAAAGFLRIRDKKNSRIRIGLAVLLIIVLLLANSSSPVHASGSSAGDTDTATMLLVSMGALSADSDGNYNLTNTVTRAEFAKMLVMASQYKDLVQTTSYSSPYKDVPAKNWAAPYIRLAVSNGLMSGYSDGTFRPDDAVTLEQAVNSVLLLLGYTAGDFIGAFPYAQMNVYSNNGLSQNISGGIGTHLTKRDAAYLIYNLMGTGMKDGSGTYAESLGYSLNDSGVVDYAGVISDNMYGPYTVKTSSWAYELGMDSSGLTIYKNGSLIDAAEVELYDILYYSKSKGTVWVYDDKVTGIYQDASPSQNAATSVTVSGAEYALESPAAFSALSSTGTLKIGNAVTLLLGKNGGVADAVSSTVVNESAVIYVTETGTKTYENSSGIEYSSFYFKGIKPSGLEIEYASTQDWIKPGDMIKLSFDSSGRMSIGSEKAGSNIYGVVDADLCLIGSTGIAPSANIIDTNLGNYTASSLQRLDGVRLQSGDVLYYEASGGKVTTLILNDVTGDTAKYGVVTSARSGDSSGTYSYLIDGVTYTLSTSNKTLGISGGAGKFYGESGEISMITSLRGLSTKVKTFNSLQITVNDDNGVYPVYADVTVYKKTTAGYDVSTLSEALAAFQSKQLVTFYYDKDPEDGGCIRVIVY